MQFFTSLKTESILGEDSWNLLDHLVFESRDGRLFRAPLGSKTDYFSIPGLFRGILFRARKYAESAVMHDSAYRGTLEEKVNGRWVKAIVTRKYSDEYLLKDPMKYLDAPKTLIYSVYSGVRIGGWRSFNG